ncbi:hypothetical protein [Fodinibius halophilus]|uniref:Lipoprotein n=1 Tax=Fodinibius halophilus TaxID=1736908 RepID=A0A6M1T1N1_9BACT|nr:hypothetical protein [Fodinibius halophilus]NGP89978.1 hypothetical protein [Fodinibius halophilus]
MGVNMLRTCIKYFVVLILFTGLMSCGSDSTGPDPSEAPSVPSKIISEEAKPDVSFFEEEQSKQLTGGNTASTENYNAAKYTALSISGIASMNALYSGFMSPASSTEPEFKDGKWVWEYTHTNPETGDTGTFRLEAKEISEGHKWAMYLSMDTSEFSVENYKVFEGTTSSDGSEGEWIFNSIDLEETGTQEVKAFSSSWVITNEDKMETSFEFYDKEGRVQIDGGYTKDAPEHTLAVDYADSQQSNVKIYWNTENNTGYILQGTECKGWDSSFQDDNSVCP